MTYDKDSTSKKFQKGKLLLNAGRYEEAEKIFTEISELTEPYIEEDPDAKVTWNTSLTNRGTARYKRGIDNHQAELANAGLDDYRKVVSKYDKDAKEKLTAQGHLLQREEELKKFGWADSSK